MKPDVLNLLMFETMTSARSDILGLKYLWLQRYTDLRLEFEASYQFLRGKNEIIELLLVILFSSLDLSNIHLISYQ